jgi:TPR repeat protein
LKKVRNISEVAHFDGNFFKASGNLMKRAFLAMFWSAALMASPVAYADSVSDREMADRYFQAAQSGDSDAEFYLGALYSAGVGRPRSDEEAFRWFSRAADHGHSHAMLVLGGLYAIGRGGPKDNVSAYKWAYIVSLGTRVEEFRNGSRQLMGVLETRMRPDEITQAKADAGRWHATPSPAKPAVTAVSPPPPSPPAVAKQPPASATTTPAETPSSTKKSDMDALMDKIPSDVRKKLGF